jgi:transcriptional regulator with XRE-family HTH domain
MDSKLLRTARKQLKLTQKEVAVRLGVSQPYWALLESGRRNMPTRLMKRALSVLHLPATSLPLSAGPRRNRADLGRQLAALGYPGFAYLRHGWRRNPAEVLLTALAKDSAEARLVEALPWLLLHYSDMDREWLTQQARLRNLSNRLGFVVTLAKRVCERKGDTNSATYYNLEKLETDLMRSKLAREEPFGRSNTTPREMEWLREHRSPEATLWNLLTDWKAEYLQYA